MELWFTEPHTETAQFSIKVKQQLFSTQSEFQRIDVFDSEEFGLFLVIDGFMMASQKDEFIYHEMISHVPMAANPDIKEALVIGAGDGGTVRELCRYKSIEHIDMVEIDNAVVDASKKYLPFLSCSLDDKRVCIHYTDGIDFVKTKNAVYDLIIVDSTDPVGPGEGLFTKEFYANCYTALKKDGILVNQHESPYYKADAEYMKRAHRRINEVFPICSVYQAHIPSYPSGHWLFGFASKTIKPVEDLDADCWNSLGIATQYYNTELHKGCFALPNYVLKMLEDALYE